MFQGEKGRTWACGWNRHNSWFQKLGTWRPKEAEEGAPSTCCQVFKNNFTLDALKLIQFIWRKRKLEGDTVDAGPSDTKKVKKEDVQIKQEKEDETEKEEIKKQNKIMFKHRDELEKLSKQELLLLLEYNDQDAPPGISEVCFQLLFALPFQRIALSFSETRSPCRYHDVRIPWKMQGMQGTVQL